MGSDAKAAGSPLTFKAGGSPSPNKMNTSSDNSGNDDQADSSRAQTPPSRPPTQSSALSILHTGLSAKRSPFQVKNWIACVLTLDGRDKFTKVLQYTSRLLSWYFAGLATKIAATGGGGATSSGSSSAVVGTASILTALYTNLALRRQLYLAISQRFNGLYKSLVTARKAFRLGRSVIEMDKLSNMGWGEYLGYMLMHPLAGGVAGAQEEEEEEVIEKGDGMMATSSLTRYDTHPIPEGEEGSHEEEDDQDDGSETSWSEESESNDEKKIDTPSPKKAAKKVVSRPGRPKLPSKVSSNIGWGPATTTSTEAMPSTPPSKSQASQPLPRTVSEMGRQMYKPFPSFSSIGSTYKQVRETTAPLIPVTPPATPTYKLIGGTMKILGLMGFWAFDNLAFITGSGFLDPINLRSSSSSSDVTGDRAKRKKRASEWAGRLYFAGAIGGLYASARELWAHRNGLLKDAQRRVEDAKDADIDEAQSYLKQTERKHFVLFLALLKSCVDCMVFSNNPGIDLHLKLRGKKNHEGFHCLCGLTSAATVLYNNFPNSGK